MPVSNQHRGREQDCAASSAKDGRLFRVVVDADLEGVVAKRLFTSQHSNAFFVLIPLGESLAIFDAPMISPRSSFTGDTVSKTSTSVPSLRRRTLIVLNLFTAPNASKEFQLFMLSICWQENLNGVADHHFGPVTIERFGACRFDAVEVFADNRIIGGFDHSRKEPVYLFELSLSSIKHGKIPAFERRMAGFRGFAT